MLVEDTLSGWHDLIQKPATRGGNMAVYKGVKINDRDIKEATCAVLLQSSMQLDDPSLILMVFTLGLWLGQTQKASLERQVEDLDG